MQKRKNETNVNHFCYLIFKEDLYTVFSFYKVNGFYNGLHKIGNRKYRLTRKIFILLQQKERFIRNCEKLRINYSETKRQ